MHLSGGHMTSKWPPQKFEWLNTNFTSQILLLNRSTSNKFMSNFTPKVKAIVYYMNTPVVHYGLFPTDIKFSLKIEFACPHLGKIFN